MVTTDARPRGLSHAEVAARVAEGRVNRRTQDTSRTTQDILKSNLLTRFNAILTILLVVILLVAPIQDALFGVVMVMNAGIGIVQELRAKRTLDRLRLIDSPRARVVRDLTLQDIDVTAIVVDDLLEVRAGDQVPVDGVVEESEGLEIDESLLTGEADPVAKAAGGLCRSGSVVVAGAGAIRATHVGDDAFAARLAGEAKRFTLVQSELRRAIDVLLAVIGWSLVPIGGLLMWSLRDVDGGYPVAIRSTVAAMVAMIPQGLVLLTSIAFAVAVVRLGRRRTLVQELPAVEILARVDTLCLDKTGTITKGRLEVTHSIGLDTDSDWRRALGALVWSDPAPNATSLALRRRFPDPKWPTEKVVPFTAGRGWSGARFAGRGTFLLGGLDRLVPERKDLATRAEELARTGLRVLVLAHERGGKPEAVALVALGDGVRHDAPATLQYFRRQGVDTKIISGDDPVTVAAIAAKAGITDPRPPVDGRRLPSSDDELSRLVARHRVFGRVDPHAKRRIVRALQASGRVVAMTGDGVNDVLALKDADIGIAMGSGSPASRAVAQLVLLDNGFATLPDVVAEGRRIIANIERVANLFLAKTIYAVLLALATAASQLAFPFLPRHLTLVGSLTIGIPGFFLALESGAGKSRPGLLRRVWRFALPTGALAAAASYWAYGIAQAEGADLAQSRAAATIVLTAVGLFILAVASRPLTPARKTLIAAMAALMIAVFVSPSMSAFYALPLPRPVVVLAAVGITALTGTFMWMSLKGIGWMRMAASIVTDPPRRTALSAQAQAWARRRLAAVTGERRRRAEFDAGTASVSAPDAGVLEQLSLPLTDPPSPAGRDPGSGEPL